MHSSRPQVALVLHAFEPGGTMRQAPARQNSPEWQSPSAAQTAEQKPLLQASPEAQSLAVVQAGSLLHSPELHEQDE
jgi:hypothetical protein